MTATNFRDLLGPIEHFKASDGMWSTRILDADDLLARPVPWVDCPTCNGEGVEFAGDEDGIGDGCPACTGTGKATVAQLLAWGSAVAEPIESPRFPGDDKYDDVADYRNRILGVQP